MEVTKQVGPETTLDAAIKDGKIVLKADYLGADLGAGAYISTTPAQLSAALAKLIPGDTAAEKMFLTLLEGAISLADKSV